MKTTIRTIEERYKEDLEAQKMREEEIQQMESHLEDLRAKLEEAKKNGDIETFKATKKSIEDSEDVIEVLKAMDKHKSFSPFDVSEAWKNFREDYDRVYDRLDGECKKKGKEFSEAYKKLLEHQNSGLRSQQMLAELAGITPESDGVGRRSYTDIPLRYIPEKAVVQIPGNYRMETPEVLFFVGSGLWSYVPGVSSDGSGDALSTAWAILHNHIPVPEIKL